MSYFLWYVILYYYKHFGGLPLCLCSFFFSHFCYFTGVHVFIYPNLYSFYYFVCQTIFPVNSPPFFMSIHAFMHTALLYIKNINIYLYVYESLYNVFFFVLLLQHQTLTPYNSRIYFMILFFFFSTVLLLLLSVIIRGCFWKETE